MFRMLRWLAVGVPLVLAFSVAGYAQDGVLEELYGRGVHAFFASRYQEAHGLLSDAIAQGSQDPRAYYFRAMCYSRLGRDDEAKADYADGAKLEVANGDIFPIGRSLERVQGGERMVLEDFRKQARIDARRVQNNVLRARYQEVNRAEADVLRNPAAAGMPPAAAPGAADPTDPFGGNPGAAPAPAAPAPAAPAADPNDPFGAPAAPAAPAPAAPAPAAPAADPNDPFGAPAAPAAPAPAAPAPAAPAADPNDPFGAPAAPAAPAPAAPGNASIGGKSTIGSIFKAFVGAIPTGKTAPGAAPAMPADQSDPFKDDPVQPAPGAAPAPAVPPAANDPFGN